MFSFKSKISSFRRHILSFLANLSQRLKFAIVTPHRLSSSVVCLRLLTFHIFDFFSETAERILTKLDMKQVPRVLYQLCVSWVDPSLKMAALASDWLTHFFDFSSATTERILTKLDRKQVPKVLYQLCVFWADLSTKMAALASDWPTHFSTSPLQPLKGFDET